MDLQSKPVRQQRLEHKLKLRCVAVLELDEVVVGRIIRHLRNNVESVFLEPVGAAGDQSALPSSQRPATHNTIGFDDEREEVGIRGGKSPVFDLKISARWLLIYTLEAISGVRIARPNRRNFE